MPIFRAAVEQTWTGAGSPGVNVWHFRTTDQPEFFADIQEAVDALHTFYRTLAPTLGTASPLYTTGHTFELDGVVNVETSEFHPVTWETWSAASQDSDAPAATQLCISWRTSIAARRGMGRTFLGPCSLSAVDTDGSPTDGVLLGVRNAAQALIDTSSAVNDWAFGVYGRQDPVIGSPRVLRDFTAARVADKFAVLRSRRD